jgi:hypothetical protein
MPTERFFEPARANKDQQDVTWVPNEIDNTLKGGSAHPGSAAGYAAGSGQVSERIGFVGTKEPPAEP